MSELSFDVLDMSRDPYAASPTLLARMRVAETTGEVIHTLSLRCQLKIEVAKRRYTEEEQERLADLFGEPYRWGQTLKPFTWTHASTVLPGFEGSTEFDLPIQCTYDFEVIGSRYLHALTEGVIPLEFLFSGTLIARGATGYSVEQVPWHKAAEFDLPAKAWHDLMDQWFPGTGWLRLRRDTIDGLGRYKSEQGLATWDEAVERALKRAGEPT